MTIWRKHRRVGWVLVPVAVLYLLFLSLQGRYFGRWLLPIFPIACLLAANFALEAAGWAASRMAEMRISRVAFVAVAVIALVAQGLLYSIHSGLVLLTRRHAQPHARVGGEEHTRGREDRGRAGGSERVAG